MAKSKVQIFYTPLSYNDNPSNYPFGSASASLGQIDEPGNTRDDLDMNAANGTGGNGTRYFRFALLDANTSANVIAGDVVSFLANAHANYAGFPSDGIVTSNTASSDGRNALAGVAIGNVTKGNYGWFQIAGFISGVNTTGSTVAKDDILVASATDKRASNIADGNAITQIVLGRATANTANLTPAYLTMFPQ